MKKKKIFCCELQQRWIHLSGPLIFRILIKGNLVIVYSQIFSLNHLVSFFFFLQRNSLSLCGLSNPKSPSMNQVLLNLQRNSSSSFSLRINMRNWSFGSISSSMWEGEGLAFFIILQSASVRSNLELKWINSRFHTSCEDVGFTAWKKQD